MDTTPGGFVPPHCPNPNCRFHNPLTPGWRFKKAGFFSRRRRPHRVQRYRCHACLRHFSRQTFDVTYWLKRPDVLPALLTKTVGCMANRQIARDLGVSPRTVDGQLARLARHCLLFHALRIAHSPPPAAVVVDGFETFELSQYFPFHFNLCVDKHSDFILAFTDSELRRKGRMTPEQRARRRELESRFGRPDPKAVRRHMHTLLRDALGAAPAVTIHSDEHTAYPPAFRSLPARVSHRVTPGSAPRTPQNPLFPVNLLDALIRHSQAGHKRETIAFAKRRAASAERLAIFLVWRNYIKGRREKSRTSPTPAMVRGLAARPLTVARILATRLFFDHVRLPERWHAYYRRSVRTRALARQQTHHLKYAF
jgi:transposase-like protein